MFRAEVAQSVEHSPEKAGVDSSILSLGTTSPSHTDCAAEEGGASATTSTVKTALAKASSNIEAWSAPHHATG